MASHFKSCQNVPSVSVEGLWVFDSELLHQSGVMSIQPPALLCQPSTGLISSGSSRPLYFPSLLHISFKQVLLEDSNLEQCNIVKGVHIAVVLRLMKMLDSAAFYTRSGNNPAVFWIHLGHSCYIPSTFEVHSRYSSCIFLEFLDA